MVPVVESSCMAMAMFMDPTWHGMKKGDNVLGAC